MRPHRDFFILSGPSGSMGHIGDFFLQLGYREARFWFDFGMILWAVVYHECSTMARKMHGVRQTNQKIYRQ